VDEETAALANIALKREERREFAGFEAPGGADNIRGRDEEKVEQIACLKPIR
jgi:hypothetical protein